MSGWNLWEKKRRWANDGIKKGETVVFHFIISIDKEKENAFCNVHIPLMLLKFLTFFIFKLLKIT